MVDLLVLAADAAVEGDGYLTPVGEHDLLLFWIQLVVLLATARALGALMRRVGQPAVVGELAAGLLIGPSILGRVAPGLGDWLFPGGEVSSSLLLAVAWLGIFLLLVVTGFETDLGLLRRLGRPAFNVSLGSLLVPLAMGLALGFLLPGDFLGDPEGRVGFALFMGVALSISALPVVAKILADMNLMRRDFGQITIAAGMANDLVGWLMLGAMSGIVASGGFDLRSLLVTLAAVTVFLVASFTIGQRGADQLLRRARGSRDSFTGALTATLLVALVLGAITHAIGVEAVLGALVAGIVLGRSRYQHDGVRHTLETLSSAVFAPIFFATAGLYVDFGVVFEGSNWVWAIVVVLVAAAGKLVGSYAAARMSAMSRMEGLAIGLGLNARGALEIVVATIGFSLGVLNDVSYAIVVVMALVTSMAAPALLRPVLRRLTAAPAEAERLHREETLQRSVVAAASHVLMPSRGGLNSLAAAQLLDLSLQPEASVTVLSVAADGAGDDLRDATLDQIVRTAFTGREVHHRRHVAADPAADVLREAALGYDLMVLGLNDEFSGTHELSSSLRRMIGGSQVPILLVRRSRRSGFEVAGIRRVLVPVSGTRVGRAAEEIAYVLAGRLDAAVDAIHVTDPGAGRRDDAVSGQLARSRDLAQRFGGAVSVGVRSGAVRHEEVLREAATRGSDLVVMGATARQHEPEQPFLGYGTEYLLEHADAMVAVVVFPDH